jgi:hypothetical protein
MERKRKIIVEKVKNKTKKIKQRWYDDHSKRTFNWMIKNIMPRCEIYQELLLRFFEERHKREELIDEVLIRSILYETVMSSTRRKISSRMVYLKPRRRWLSIQGAISHHREMTNSVVMLENCCW